MEQKQTYKRRIIVVNRAFQFKYAAITVGLFAIAAFIVWWEIYQSITGLTRQGLITDPEVMIALENINKVVLIKILIAQGLVTFLSILISHYVAGPIFRVEKSLNVLKTGDLTHRIYLRKFDQFTGLAAMFNETMETLHNTIKQDRAKLDGAIKKIESAGGEKKIADAIDDLKQVNKSFTI